MKRKYYVIVILFVVALSMIPGFSSATTEMKLILSTKDKFNINEEIEVKVISKGEGNTIQGIQGILNFDNNVLEYKGKKSLHNDWMVTGFNSETGKFLLELSDDALQNGGVEVSDGEEICSFSFKVKDSSNVSDTTIVLTELLAVGYGKMENSEVKIAVVKREDNEVDNTTNNTVNNTTNTTVNDETNNTVSDITNNTVDNINNAITISNIDYPKAGEKNKGINIVIAFVATFCIFCYFILRRYKEI